MGSHLCTMPPRISLRWRRTALFAIAVWILMTGGAESDVVEGVNDLTGFTSPQELVPPFEGSSTTDLQQVVGAPKNHALGRSAGADPVQLQSEEVANGTGEQVTPDTDTPLAPTGKDKNRQLRSELDQMRSKMKATEERHGKEMKATEERHGKEIAKLETLVNANMQPDPRAANADVKARLLPAARPMHQHGLVPLGEAKVAAGAVNTFMPASSGGVKTNTYMPASSGDVKTNTYMPASSGGMKTNTYMPASSGDMKTNTPGSEPVKTDMATSHEMSSILTK